VCAVQRLVGQLPPPLSSTAQTRRAQWARAGLSTVGLFLNSEGRVEDSDALARQAGVLWYQKHPSGGLRSNTACLQRTSEVHWTLLVNF